MQTLQHTQVLNIQTSNFQAFVYVHHIGSSLSRVSSSSPSSTTPTEAEGGPQSYHSPVHVISSEIEDETPPPPIASRPERTKSIVGINIRLRSNFGSDNDTKFNECRWHRRRRRQFFFIISSTPNLLKTFKMWTAYIHHIA